MNAPEKIWIAGFLDECGEYYPNATEAEGDHGGKAVEYIRADLAPTLPSADYVAGLEAALQAIADLSGKSGKEFKRLHPALNAALDKRPHEHWYDVLSEFANEALAARPDQPAADTRVVTVREALRVLLDNDDDGVIDLQPSTVADLAKILRTFIGEPGK